MRVAMRMLVGVGLVAAGCLEPQLVPCGDRSCPRGTACRAETCVDAGAIAACVDKGERAACELAGVAGECVDGACMPLECGDGFVTSDEVCDDGNNASADGCASDCRSRELCGDGIRNDAVDEACDDGNTKSADGCSATCAREQLAFERVATSGPSPRCGTTMTYEPAAMTVLLFGGDDCAGGGFVADTWRWDGAAWQQLTVAGPSPRSGAMMAADLGRGEIILFGGRDQVGALGDTWRWDGAAWTLLAPATSPAAGSHGALVYDAGSAVLVMFGGTSGERTWTFDGATWAPHATAGAQPSTRRGHALAYDPVQSRLVLYGGRSLGGAFLGDLWELRGNAWTVLVDSASATERSAFSVMTFHAGHGAITRHGGTIDASLEEPRGRSDGTWFLSSSLAWQRAAFFPQPRKRDVHAAAYDAARELWVIFGGVDDAGTAQGDTWTFGYRP